MSLLSHWGLFFLDTITLVIAILLTVAGTIAITTKQRGKEKGTLFIKKLNTQFKETIATIHHEMLDKKELKSLEKATKKSASKKENTPQKHLFVVDFHGDIKASAVSTLRECITSILLTARPDDEVLLRLESPGGTVPGYGLAASQLQRLRDGKIKLTVAVDKIAASGGYLMACIADTLISAPFAIIGSIGVVYQLPNFNRLLQKKSVDFEQITAGDYKRTLTMFGENTKQDRQKVQQDVNDMHELFKQHVASHRQHINIEEVATGEYWYGTQAIKLHLVDQLQTSDDFILQAKDHFEIFLIDYKVKEKLGKKLSQCLSLCYTHLLEWHHHA